MSQDTTSLQQGDRDKEWPNPVSQSVSQSVSHLSSSAPEMPAFAKRTTAWQCVKTGTPPLSLVLTLSSMNSSASSNFPWRKSLIPQFPATTSKKKLPQPLLSSLSIDELEKKPRTLITNFLPKVSEFLPQHTQILHSRCFCYPSSFVTCVFPLKPSIIQKPIKQLSPFVSPFTPKLQNYLTISPNSPNFHKVIQTLLPSSFFQQ